MSFDSREHPFLLRPSKLRPKHIKKKNCHIYFWMILLKPEQHVFWVFSSHLVCTGKPLWRNKPGVTLVFSRSSLSTSHPSPANRFTRDTSDARLEDPREREGSQTAHDARLRRFRNEKPVMHVVVRVRAGSRCWLRECLVLNSSQVRMTYFTLLVQVHLISTWNIFTHELYFSALKIHRSVRPESTMCFINY